MILPLAFAGLLAFVDVGDVPRGQPEMPRIELYEVPAEKKRRRKLLQKPKRYRSWQR